MNLRQLEVFHAIMITGSVTGAARLLNVTQPAVSSVLKHCEDQLRMKLFARVSGRLKPTAEAEAIFPDVASIFGRLEAVDRMTQDLVGGRLGRLSMAAAFPLANGYLSRAVGSFIKERPEIRVSLHCLQSPEVVNRVLNQEVEFGVAYETIDSDAVDTEVLTRAGLACVIPRDHPLATRETITIADLAAHPLVSYGPQALLRPFVDQAFRDAGFVPDIAVQVNLSLTGIMLADSGAGVALVEPFLAKALRLDGVVVRELTPAIEFRTLLISRKGVPPSTAMRDFVAHLKAMLGAELESAPLAPDDGIVIPFKGRPRAAGA